MRAAPPALFQITTIVLLGILLVKNPVSLDALLNIQTRCSQLCSVPGYSGSKSSYFGHRLTPPDRYERNKGSLQYWYIRAPIWSGGRPPTIWAFDCTVETLRLQGSPETFDWNAAVAHRYDPLGGHTGAPAARVGHSGGGCVTYGRTL